MNIQAVNYHPLPKQNYYPQTNYNFPFEPDKAAVDFINSVENNVDYRELKNNKLFDKTNLMSIMLNLKGYREQAIMQQYQESFILRPYNTSVVHPPINYSEYDIPDYLRMLNDFVKTDKLSDDFKQYYIVKNASVLEPYHLKLNKINEVKTNQEALNLFLF